MLGGFEYEKDREGSCLESTVYVAEDGTEFTDARKCQEHEKMIKRQAFLEELPNLTLIDRSCYAPCDGLEYREDCKYDWLEVAAESDVEELQQFVENDIVVSSYPTKICLETNFDDDVYFVGEVEDSINYAKELLGALGYDVVVKLKQ